ncbi:DUF58 domain-containing protein [Pseudoruegeria sp. SHC-113]|uniref:DUF58 domain-containing protein n=1 Tax=Pseudoruegeria sp. SHC-113 TaxID=2855439 RepID=UPI0021BA8BF7|nr:DUF58 domain-containing protein [Pseudoruegeria sp. SHC-113]MCT8161382.1 DUF58 domain-containing protein [Pseudoruegeria sp. SHC-113]
MRDRAARTRAGLDKPPRGAQAPRDPRLYADLDHLRALEAQARSLTFLPRQPAGSVLNGRHASRLRGRGLNFEELRDYLPSDDVRSIDWKVTARTGTPHVRVYTEERDRPALIVVDQRMSMFFGSVHNLKSVTAAEAAALAAHRILDQGDRVGGIVFGDGADPLEFRPKRNRAAVSAFLTALAKANLALHAEAPPQAPLALNTVLKSVSRLATRDHLVLLISDFDGIDARTEILMKGIARHNDLILLPVWDPSARAMPFRERLVISDGDLQAEIDMERADTTRALEAAGAARLERVLGWQNTAGAPVLPLSTAEDTLPQIRRLMGLGAGRRR